jgi:hypothetical protein
MADTGTNNPLSSQVSHRATQAGLWMIAGAAALFIAGVFAGLTLERRLMGQGTPVAAAHANTIEIGDPAKEANDSYDIRIPLIDPNIEPGSPAMRDAVAERVTQILKLDPNQQRQVRGIIEKYTPRTEELRRRFEPELRKLALEALADLMPILQPDQRQHLERLLERHARGLLNPTTQSSRAKDGTGEP